MKKFKLFSVLWGGPLELDAIHVVEGRLPIMRRLFSCLETVSADSRYLYRVVMDLVPEPEVDQNNNSF